MEHMDNKQKIGRPKSEKPKIYLLQVRVDKSKYEEIHDYCQLHGITKTELLREGIECILKTKG